MIPHVVFLLRDGLKTYFGWISQVLRSKHVPKLCTKTWDKKKHIKEVIYTLPQAPFRKENIQKIMKIWEFLQNHEKSWKMSSILCRRRLFAKQMLKRSWKIWGFLEDHETIRKQCHLFFVAKQMFNKSWKIWESHKNMKHHIKKCVLLIQ